MNEVITSTLEQFIRHVSGTPHILHHSRHPAPKVELIDGTSMSVQAGAYLYCTPRRDYAEFTHVEVGFPSFDPPEEWMEYAEDSDSPQDTVYGYIPIEMVLDYINSVGIKPEDGSDD